MRETYIYIHTKSDRMSVDRKGKSGIKSSFIEKIGDLSQFKRTIIVSIYRDRD